MNQKDRKGYWRQIDEVLPSFDDYPDEDDPRLVRLASSSEPQRPATYRKKQPAQ